MGCLFFLWPTLLFTLGLLVIHCGEARVLTEVQSGPLYRVVSYSLSISCNVSGFSKADMRQEFEFRMRRPDRPMQEINIISSSDPDFSYSIYSRRVTSKDVTLEHVSPTSVLFKIQNLMPDDEGEYECSVKNSEKTYDGTYAAKTTIKVIDNSLITSTSDSASLSHDEGEALTLTCQASSNTVQHTHLSVTWYLHKDGEDSGRPIISLDRDFTLSPGPGFSARYQAGLITLDKVGEATFRLKMAQLELSDQGKIYCQAQEWIQDPDRSWYSIAKKDTKSIILNVKAKDVVPDEGSLVVTVSVQKTNLQVGQELSLSCNVDAQNLAERFFSVAWFRNDVELARIGPTGVLSVGTQYRDREKAGELRATRTGDRDHRLILRSVRTQDQGEYFCRAWPQGNRGTDGTFTQGAAQDSSPQVVTIVATESGLSVEMEEKNVTVNEGDKLQLTCKVTGFKGQLSVTWQYRSGSIAMVPFSNVISLSQEGVMELGVDFRKRTVKAMRPAADIFTLELNQVTPSDAGIYQCTVSDGKMDTTNVQSQNGTVAVSPVDSLLKVSLKSRNTVAKVGDEVELMCLVRGPPLPVTVSWTLQRVGASTPDNVLTLSPRGDVTWGGDRSRYQLKTDRSPNALYHTLVIMGVSLREAGRYQCEVSVILENIHKKLPPSNLLAVMVENPESKLSLTSGPSETSNVNTDVELKCSVVKATSPSSRFAVTWMLQRQAEDNRTLLSSDRDTVVTFEPQVESSNGQRISMKRGKGLSFELTIRQARTGDSGTYFCGVVEWLQDPRGEWYQYPSVSTSTKLRIEEPDNDLRFDKTELQLMVSEGEEVEVSCNLTSGASNPSFLYTLTWFYTGTDPSVKKVPLVQLDYSGLLRYSDNQRLRDLQGRLRLSRPAQSSFHLGIQRAHEGDSGTYRCQVEQYQLNHQGLWEKKASDDSGPITLTVKATESKLSLTSKPSETSNVNTDVELKCSVVKATSPSSRFAVTWMLQRQAEDNRTLLSSDRDAVVTFEPQVESSNGQRISMKRSEGLSFELTIRQARTGDSGTYFCGVVEWLQDPCGEWYQYPSVSTSTELRIVEPDNDLRFDKTELQLMVSEGEEVEVSCNLTSGASNPSFLYTLTWFYKGTDPSVKKVPLVQLDYSGLLRYSDNQRLRDLQGRLRLSRPAQSSFHLGIQRAHEGDSGTYRCQVEQYQLNHQGLWEQKASDDSGPITLTVKATESNLSVEKEDVNLNMTGSQEFTIPCNITAQSIQWSAFHVTWFWQKKLQSEHHPIFTSYQNSTLQDRSGRGKRLRFSHPAPNFFSLTVFDPIPEDSGLYFCEVEEWLLSPPQSGRKMAVEKSGELTVNIHTEGDTSEVSDCHSGSAVGVLTGVIICLAVVVVLLLLLTIYRSKASGAKKQEKSLWVEEHPLKSKPSPEDYTS
ncbi:immunoglobulin superfamily member 2-like [Polymixia lowei]